MEDGRVRYGWHKQRLEIHEDRPIPGQERQAECVTAPALTHS